MVKTNKTSKKSKRTVSKELDNLYKHPKKELQIIGNDIAKYVKKNPKKAAVIGGAIAAAIATGIIASKMRAHR